MNPREAQRTPLLKPYEPFGAKTLIEIPFEFALSFIREQSAKRTCSASPLLFFSGLMYLFSPLKASGKARQPIKQQSVFFTALLTRLLLLPFSLFFFLSYIS